MDKIQMFGKVWGLQLIYDFFAEHELISPPEALLMKENNLYFRNVMIQFAREDL